MKSIVKKSLALLLAGLILAGFAGCISPGADKPGTRPEITSVPSEAPADDPTEAPTEAPSGAPSEDYPLPEDPDAVGDCVKDAEVLLHIPFETLTQLYSAGENDDCAGFKEIDDIVNDVEAGPESFCVINGRVFLLDTLKNRIIVSDNGRISAIPTADNPERICVIGDVIYVSKSTLQPLEIAAYDMAGNELERIPLPEDVFSVFYLLEYEGDIAVLASGGALYRLTDGKWIKEAQAGLDNVKDNQYSFTIQDRETVFTSGSWNPMQYVWTDSMLYVIGFKAGEKAGSFDYAYLAYDRDGNLTGSTFVDPKSMRSCPDNPIYTAGDGTLYVMCWTQDGVYVTKPHLRAV